MNRRPLRPFPTLATWLAASALLVGCDLTAPDPVPTPDVPSFEVRHLNRTTPLYVLDDEGRIVHLIPVLP